MSIKKIKKLIPIAFIAIPLILMCKGPNIRDRGLYSFLTQGDSINSTSGSSLSEVFAVSEVGSISYYATGYSWEGMSSGTTNNLKDVWGSSESDVFAVGANGIILHYDGNPEGAWSAMDNSITTNILNGVWGSSGADVFAVGANGIILHYDGNPEGAWSAMDNSITTNILNGVWGSSATDVFAVGWSGAILHYDGGGSDWEAIGSRSTRAHYFSGVWGTSTSDVFAVGGFTDNEIFHYDGNAWENTFSSEGDQLFLQAVWGSSTSDVFAVGTGGTIHHYNGSLWDTMNSGTINILSGVWGSSGNNVFTVGSGGITLHYDGNPEGTWSSEIESGTTKKLSGIWGSSASDVFVVGNGGTILRLHSEVTPPSTTSTSVRPATTTIPIPPATTTSIAECELDEQCDDELFCTGEESCVEGRCRSVGNPCEDDNLFCNGEEICDEENDECVSSENPCLPNLECNEESDACSGCLNDEECDDELFCDGAERCEKGVCRSENDPCEAGEQCDEENDECKIPPAPCEISMEPNTGKVVSGQTLNFTVITASGDCTDSDYKWSVISDIESTIDKNGNYAAGTNDDLFASATDVVSVLEQTSGSESSVTVTVSWKCFLIQIYGEEPETIALLRDFRDHVLSKTPEGREIIKLYYELSPFIVNTMEKDGVFKDEVKDLVEGVLPLLEIQ